MKAHGPSPRLAPKNIEPVRDDAPRPRWSIVIPTFNCAQYLERTLSTALEALCRVGSYEVLVVDDQSTKDDPEAVTERYLARGVRFHRNEANLGAVPNFNNCISLARGEYVHILHGDDYVAPSFYEEVQNALQADPQIDICATGVIYVDESDREVGRSGTLKGLDSPQARVDWGANTPFQFAGVVVRRQTYERRGGFIEGLVHCADMEMWYRAFAAGKGAVIDRHLAFYRVFAENDTARLKRLGENGKDLLRYADLLRHRELESDARKVNRRIPQLAFDQYCTFKSRSDFEAASNNRALFFYALRRVPLLDQINFMMRLVRFEKSEALRHIVAFITAREEIAAT